jgi:nucleotide-binding universal stress UspA family protein
MKTVLVTTDLSEESRAAFPAAAEYAALCGAKVLLLAVIHDSAQTAMMYALDFPVMPDAEIQKQLRQRVEDELESMVQSCFAGLSCERLVVESIQPIHSEIVRVAAERAADLIVMATRGSGGITHLLTGNVTTKVLRETNRPVLVVPVKHKKK